MAPRSELAKVAASFGMVALIRLVSSIVLTRILYPQAYGIVTIVATVVYTIDMLSDIGIATLMIRHEKAESDAYLHTLWTFRFVRSLINASIVFLAAPWVADFYGTQELTLPLRLFSLYFLFQGLESMSLLRAVRRQRASVPSIIEAISLLISTVVSIAISLHTVDHFGMVIGMLVNRGATAAMSYAIGDPFRPRFAFDREAFRELMKIGKFVLPSTLVTMALSQYDKVIFLRLFDLTLLGLYGLASSVIQAVESIVVRITRHILLPACAEAFRRDRASVVDVYYRANAKLHVFILVLPAFIGGAADLIVATLFDARYAYAALILQAFAIRSVLISFYSCAEDLLVASGYNHIGLTGQLLRVAWLVPGALVGYYFFGFEGFLFMTVLDHLPGIVYFLRLQHRNGFLIARYEIYRVGLVVAVVLCTLPLAYYAKGIVLALKASLRQML